MLAQSVVKQFIRNNSASVSSVESDAPLHVSIIVAMYNVDETVEATLESIMQQDYPYWEAVLVDDGSTDGTNRIASRYVRYDQRFRLISQANGGVSAARNSGIQHATHEWILFLDADDWIEPDHLQVLTQALNNDKSLDGVYCGWAYITADGYKVFPEVATQGGDLFAMHAEQCPFAIHSFILRRKLVESIGGFDPELVVCEDWDVWQRVSRTGARFGAVKGLIAPYRMRPTSASMDGRRILKDGLQVLSQGYRDDLRVREPHPAFPAGFSDKSALSQRYYLLCSSAGLVLGRYEDARFLLDELPNEPCPTLHAHGVAECVVQGVVLAAGKPLAEWKQVWVRALPNVQTFLAALEERTEVPNLSTKALLTADKLLTVYMGQLGPTHFLHARSAQLAIYRQYLRTGMVENGRIWAWYLMQTSRNCLQVFPYLYQKAHGLRRRYAPRENRAFFEELFGESPDPWAYTSGYEQTKYEQTLELAVDKGSSKHIATALEIACAEGHFTAQLASHVQRLTAADISDVALGRAAERCNEQANIDYRQLDLVRDEIEGTYDLITCSEVLYFTRDYRQLRKVAKKVANALNPGGRLVMAHGNVVVDDSASPGFGWDHQFGAKRIGETFSSIPGLDLVEEIRTPIYRVHAFQRKSADQPNDPTPLITQVEQPTELPADVEEQVFWHGCSVDLPILMYHRVAPNGSDALADWRVSPHAFEEQLRYLRDEGYHSTTFDDWRGWVDQRAPIPRKAVMITFDDGYRDFAQYAWPLLQKYGFTATVFLVTSLIGQTNKWDHQQYGEVIPLLDWKELRALQRSGVSFGSHSMTHPSLTWKLPSALLKELHQSKAILEDGLSVEVNAIAYPFGNTNRLVQLAAGAVGYAYGVTCEWGAASVGDSLLAMPRVEIEGTDNLATFINKLID
ncbi:MAG: trifunctional glycosyltransferase/class I SAM-dependent methyltransferase/polysaccharide deacetylase [Chloroflexota bacterium]